mgnify:CR=1 FL=1
MVGYQFQIALPQKQWPWPFWHGDPAPVFQLWREIAWGFLQP